MRFSADQAFEAAQDGDPIILDTVTIANILRQHGDGEDFTVELYVSETEAHGNNPYDAAELLGWLGY